ncbi:hypothetical protein F3Y22_tig00111783pilonHSYRG00548 [Hibiscus syriacus]|uniref:DUF7032 domain-containing protein n=1 Tax=Hibiscus syriacus TaxID=106335 RepID=A0A6A2XCP8_HIBSY|nr:uncharacterized protein LOC120170624 [Hibiscus syriacus]KAE8673501.1 hypothetical protein F3Y22_tig00111783pilonHSYRG00548 [Hibiscus syriacus]
MSIESCDFSSILVTLNECCDLARRCLEISYSGKLLMQSDLDVVIAKFNSHVNNLSGIYAVGILSRGFSIVVSRLGLGAWKEDMRFYIRDLLTSMKIGDTDMKRQALDNLYLAVGDDERYVKLVVEIGDIVYVLVEFLDSSDMGIQEHASKILSLISGFDLYKGFLVKAGIIRNLIRVLESGSDLGKEKADKCLYKLTVNANNARSVSAYGGVTAL